MRIGIVSDLHGNLPGLETALVRMGAVDEVWCAGDAFDQFRFSNEVVARLREVGARYALGNHEHVLLSPAGARAQAHPDVDQDLLDWVRKRPRQVDRIIDGTRVLMFHATPWAPYDEYVYPHSPDLARLGQLETDIVVYGHTHTQLTRTVGATLVVNPGSAGLAQDPANGRRLSCAVLDTASREVRIENFDEPMLG